MKKIIILVILLFSSLNISNNCSAQSLGKAVKAVAKTKSKQTIRKEIAKESADILTKKGIQMTGRKYTGMALGEQLIKRVAREKVVKAMEKDGIESFLQYGAVKIKKAFSPLTISRTTTAMKKVSETNYHTSIKKIAYKMKQKTGKTVVKKETRDNAAHLIKNYCSKEGIKKFMSLSMKERMNTMTSLTKYTYSLPKIERDKVLNSMNTVMKEKIEKCHKLMTTRMPPIKTPKGHWSGERGNSYFILNDDYVWHGQSVKELKKKYKIKGELKIRYIDGEPIFDKNSCLGKTSVEYKPEYNYKNIKDLHNDINENLAKEPWMKGRMNNRTVDPVRDYIENAAVDGTRISGARNTYHEAMDGETIYIVPDFIHDICKHNGGRSLAALVQK